MRLEVSHGRHDDDMAAACRGAHWRYFRLRAAAGAVRTLRKKPTTVASVRPLLIYRLLAAQDKTPELPPIKVPGKETPSTTPQTTPNQPPQQPQDQQPPQPPQPSVGNPISNGGVFGSGTAVQGYKADTATSGTKVDMPLINYPGTLSVITSDLIKDQSILSVDDLLRNVPSAIKLTDFGNLRDNFILRRLSMSGRTIFAGTAMSDPEL